VRRRCFRADELQHTNWSYAQAESTYCDNQIEPISFYGYTSLTMVDPVSPHPTLAWPGGLGADGESFTD
jgi:hypothetical protein